MPITIPLLNRHELRLLAIDSLEVPSWQIITHISAAFVLKVGVDCALTALAAHLRQNPWLPVIGRLVVSHFGTLGFAILLWRGTSWLLGSQGGGGLGVL